MRRKIERLIVTACMSWNVKQEYEYTANKIFSVYESFL